MMRVALWGLFLTGAACIIADCLDFTITGLFFAGVVLWLIFGWVVGVFTREFWVADETTSDRMSAVDVDLDADADLVAAYMAHHRAVDRRIVRETLGPHRIP